MKAFKSRYLQKCRDQQIEPIQTILHLSEDIDRDVLPILNLGELTLGVKNAIAIAHALEGNQIFKEIILSESYMGDDGCVAVCNALQKNVSCSLLNLKGGNIHAKGATAIARLLKVNRSIQSLILEWNNIGVYETGITEISQALRTNRTLTILDLRNNKITPEGAHVLANVLKDQNSIVSLDLRWNSIGVSGGRALEDCLHDNHTLTELHVAGNEIDYKTQQAIDSLLNRNRDLKVSSEKEMVLAEKLQNELNHSQLMQSRKIKTLQDQVELQHEDYTKQLTSSHKKINFLEAENLSYSQKLRETERLLEKEKYDTEDLKRQLAMITEGELLITKKNLDRESNSHSETKKLYVKVSEELKDAISRIETLEQDNKRLSNTVRKLNEDIESKEEKLMIAGQKILSLENDKSEQQGHLMENQRRIEFLQSNVKSLQLIEGEYSKLKIENQEIRTATDKEILEMKNALRKEKVDLERLHEERKNGYLSKIDCLNKEIGELKSEITNCNSAKDTVSKEFEKRLEKLQEKYRVLETDKNQLQSEFDKLSVDAKHLKFACTEAKNKTREQKKEFESKISQLTNQVDSLLHTHQTEKDSYERKISQKNEEIAKLQNEIRELQYERVKTNESHEKQLFSIETQLIGQVKQLLNDARKIK